MSNETGAKPVRKRGAPKVKNKKARVQITLDPSIHRKGRKLAFSEGLALSTWIDRLIRDRVSAAESPTA